MRCVLVLPSTGRRWSDVNDLEAVFTVECAGGCGRESQTMRVSELWTPQYCPDCRAQEATDD